MIETKLIFFTNIPTPYRENFHESMSTEKKIKYHVFYSRPSESNRKWAVPQHNYHSSYFNGRTLEIGERNIHFDRDVFSTLNAFNPDIVVITGLQTTAIKIWIWCKLRNKKYIALTDGILHSEAKLSIFHKLLRKLVYSHASQLWGASVKSCELLRRYSFNNHIIHTPICIDVDKFKLQAKPFHERDIDLLFVGQFIKRKMPRFFAEVCGRVSKTRKISIAIAGTGPMLDEFKSFLADEGVENVQFLGFVDQNSIAKLYGRSKIFLFPTECDPWGVVASEALAAGTPTITTEVAGCANEIIVSEYNGYVIPPDSLRWTKAILEILDLPEIWNRFSTNALLKSQEYKIEYVIRRCAKGILAL